jgi:hypothetical protein
VQIESELESAESGVQPYDPQKENEIYDALISVNQDYAAKKKQLEVLQSEIEKQPTVDTTELQAKRDQVQSEIDALKVRLSKEDQIKAINTRIAELETEERNLASQIANVEKTQFVIENFTKMRVETLERRINSKFKLVKFKMFDIQINGGEVECCEALINGVPFSDANTASRINTGLDIINTLCEFYKISAPIFIDNRESIVNLIDTESQIVNLIVSEADKKLRVEAVGLEKAVA